MWVYLEVQPRGSGVRTEIKGEERAGRRTIRYEATCRAIASSFPKAEGLVIPESLPGYNYDVSLMILHLRLETISGLQHLPILVEIADPDRYMSQEFCNWLDLREYEFERIGVGQITPAENPADARAPRPIPDEVQRYVKRRTGGPWFTQGRHNQANRWGPYVFFRVMESVDPSCASERESIEERMFEEPYLKRLAGEYSDEHISTDILDRLRSEGKYLRNSLLASERGRKILVVEDRLDEGWREVYEQLFDSASVDWARTVDEARVRFDKDLHLVVLDVRLEPKDDLTAASDTRVATGVGLAKWFRSRWSPVPILVATASNKTWTLEPLLKAGVQGYWVKDSPEQADSLSHVALNVIELYRKAREVLEWSDRTRPWIQGLYEIAETVSETDVRQGTVLQQKAHSLHALLDRAFSPFSRELDDGLQLNVAFLILFSCMNDLRAWCCRVEKGEDDSKNWYTIADLGNELIVSMRHVVRKGDRLPEFEVEGTNVLTNRFPDTDASRRLLVKLGLVSKATLFTKLKNEVRNALPLTHGVTDARSEHGKRGSVVTDDRVNEMVGILRAVVEKRRALAASRS